MATYRADGADFDALNAGEDLSSSLYYCAHMDTDGDLVLAGNTEQVYGIIAEGATSGNAATVQISGVAKAIAGASFNAGVPLMSDANGKVVTATGAGAYIIGYARNASGGANEIVEVLIDRGQAHA